MSKHYTLQSRRTIKTQSISALETGKSSAPETEPSKEGTPNKTVTNVTACAFEMLPLPHFLARHVKFPS